VHCCGAGAGVSGGSGAPEAGPDDAADRDGQAGEPSGAALQAVLGGGIARIVFANAIAARPDDVELRRRFLDALSAFELPGQVGQRLGRVKIELHALLCSHALGWAVYPCKASPREPRDEGLTLRLCFAGVPAIEAEIYDSIARDFAGQPVAVDVMARRHTRADSEQQGLQVGSSYVDGDLDCISCIGHLMLQREQQYVAHHVSAVCTGGMP
jgi:hypothetical protein